MTGKTYEITETTVVTQEQLNDLLITAVEGGIDYWSHVRNYKWENVEDVSVEIGTYDDNDAPFEGDFVTVKASDLVKILHRLREFPIYPLEKGASIASHLENMDIETGDTAVQLLMFGEVIFG